MAYPVYGVQKVLHLLVELTPINLAKQQDSIYICSILHLDKRKACVMIRALQEMGRIGDVLDEYRPDTQGREARNLSILREREREIKEAKDAMQNVGATAEELHKRQQLTVYERIAALVEEDSFLPINTLYNPHGNKEGTVGVISGLGRIGELQVMVIASDNRVLAGAWLPAHEEKIFLAQDIAEKLNIPIVWLLQCSGVKLTEQARVYAGRRSGGRIFFRNAELVAKGVPIIMGVFGTNPAGGGYHAISSAVIFAQKDANMAVGGAAILSGMNPSQEGFDTKSAETIARGLLASPDSPSPGSAELHYKQTGFICAVFDTEKEVIEAMRAHVRGVPHYDHSSSLRIDAPCSPLFSQKELDFLIPMDPRQQYDIDMVTSRLVDGSLHLEYRADYGPEVYCGLVKIDGFLTALIANRQGILPSGYPDYARSKYPGIGGKLYREGLLKMAEFVTLCGRDKLPIIWLQDTTGIDVGDAAERAEVLALGQALIYSLENCNTPVLTVVLRKGSAASHYIMGGPQCRHNVLTLATPATEIYVMPGETAVLAMYNLKLVREYQDNARISEATVAKMNELAAKYKNESHPVFCARQGLVDEVVSFQQLRQYFIVFVAALHQNPKSFCPPYQMLLPRIIQDQQKAAP